VRPSESLFFDIRGLRYHVRHWSAFSSPTGAPKLVLLHGWMDVSASFQFLVDELKGDWDVYAPDWRGYGLTDWTREDQYWFADYLADLDFLLEKINANLLVGHSLGGNVASLYAGIRPERVAKLVNLEGFGMPPTRPEQAPKRYARWFDELHEKPGLRPYGSFEELASRLKKSNSRLNDEKATFLSRHWGKEEGGKVVLRSDPAHKIVNANLCRLDEAMACWREVTAPVLWVEAAESDTPKRMGLQAADLAARRAAFGTLRHEIVANAGHMLHHDQPAAVARLIEAFLAG
jgi:pimeloyl-ACP methyl ester carboxylesterase